MANRSSIWKALLIFFAVIGVVAVLAFAGMALMHGSMMGMMESFPDMAAACQSMMSARR